MTRRGERTTVRRAKLQPARPQSQRQAVWLVMRELQPITVGEVVRRTGSPASRVRPWVRALVEHGYLRETALEGQTKHYELARDTGLVPPPVGWRGELKRGASDVDRWWRSMRVLKHFRAEALVQTAAVTPSRARVNRARTYCKTLAAAGYLRRHEDGSYRLVRDSGPHAPQVRRVPTVYDPNLDTVTWTAEVAP